jgi:hypothetical protein
MSMYTQILETAIEERQPQTASSEAQALSELSQCRVRMNANLFNRGADWASTALANQIAFDVALIAFARSLGIACDPEAFEQPEVCRAELGRELASRGFPLDELDPKAWSRLEQA